MQNNPDLPDLAITEISRLFGIDSQHDKSELKSKLTGAINELIVQDFSRLINVLYRLDISEEKLKSALLTNNNEQASDIIVALIIERQLQKIKTRQKFNSNDHFSDEDKW
jgi:hypothetical protein